MIERGRYLVTVSGCDLASASVDIQAAIDEMTFPLGFEPRLGGQRQEMETSFDRMRFAILLAIFMVNLEGAWRRGRRGSCLNARRL